MLRNFLKGKRKRQLQPVEAYTILFYNNQGRDLKGATLRKFKEYEDNLGEDEPSMGLNAFRNKYLAQELRNETLDVHDEVNRFIARSKLPDYDEKDEFPDLPAELALLNGKALTAKK